MIASIIDTDLYKLTMQQAVLEKYPDVQTVHEFTSRRSAPVNEEFVSELRRQIDSMGDLKLAQYERNYLQDACPFFKRNYLEYLQNYQFKPDQVSLIWDSSKELNLQNLRMPIAGPWHETILWEVPLMAAISETYFLTVDKKWNYFGQEEKINRKGSALSIAGCTFADFGTRRRRSFRSQETVVKELATRQYKGFVGTSNVLLAMRYGVKPIGTMAHEWIMGVSALESLQRANYYALNIWNDVYHGDLGIALPDTFGTAAFFADFDGVLARLFDGIRHDSGCPFDFTDKVVAHYKKLGIDPRTKTIVFSDGLDVKLSIELNNYCTEIGIKCSFGIGTHLTNDYENSPALNMVIKLRSVARALGLPFTQVVKLSEVITKATGDADALRVAKWIYFGIPLDAKV